MPQKPTRTFWLALPGILAALSSALLVSAGSARAASEADSYHVEITAGGPYRAGATGSVKVSVTAKAGFHINDQYPYRFNTSPPPPGVSYPKPVLERADGQFEEKAAVFNLPFVASHAGQFTVGGVLKLSVCSPASCIVQKEPLAVSITVQ